MKWLQKKNKLSYCFENTTCAWEKKIKGVLKQYSLLRAMENFYFSANAFLWEFSTSFEPLVKQSTGQESLQCKCMIV